MLAPAALEAVFFDLDGTLLDTAKDLVHAVNTVLVYHAHRPRPYEFIRPLIGAGTDIIVSHCFNITPEDPRFKLYKQHIFAAYQQRLCQDTDFFPGMRDVLTTLHAANIPWGVVTNKPYWLAQPLLQALSAEFPYHCLIGRETLLTRKPNAEPLLYACHTTGVAAQNSVYIGDAKSDIIAAKNARMQSVAAAYGYINHQETPASWQADHVIHSGYDLLAWLQPRLRGGAFLPTQ